MTTGPTFPGRWFRFGPYVVDPRRRLLWRDGSLVPLTAKALEILDALLQHRARVVTKEELLAHLWPDTVVEENTLTRHVSTLRKALDERPAQHHYIVTVPGHGYQFVADVTELDECPPEVRHSLSPTVAHPVEEEPALDGSSIPAANGHVSPRPGWTFGRRRLVFALAVSGAAAGLALVLSRPARREQDAPAHRVLRQITFDTGLQREPAWSPDGQSVAYASERSGNSDIWIQTLTDPNPTRITSAEAEDSQPDWSPDGLWLVFRSERDGGGLYVVPANGGGERRIASFGYRPKWSPDGSLVLFSSSGHEGGTPKMYVVGLDGGPAQSVRADLVAGLTALQADWKPDDGRLSIRGRRGKNGWTFLTAPVLGGPVVTSIAVA